MIISVHSSVSHLSPLQCILNHPKVSQLNSILLGQTYSGWFCLIFKRRCLHSQILAYLISTDLTVGCPLSFCPLVDVALYCLSVWINNNCLMNWATLTTWASPLSLAVRCGCGLLQSVEILSVCTANQRSACSRDVVLLSRQPPTFLSQFWSSLVSAPCLFISLSPFCMCFYQRCCPSAVF